MDTIQEIQEWHDTLIDTERSPNELHQLFLDMPVLVQPGVCGGSSRSSLQGSTRRIPEVHFHCIHNIDHFHIDFCPVTKKKIDYCPYLPFEFRFMCMLHSNSSKPSDNKFQ
ncbi:hypothetical protein S245_035186, partial [Arachis hypogaea]